MNGNYVKPGIAAVVLAVLFPLYWSIALVIGAGDMGFVDALREDMLSLSWMDALFLLIGILEIYVYYSLIQSFNEQLDSNAAKVLLYIIIGTVFFFHAGVIADLFLALSHEGMSRASIDTVVGTSVYLSLAALAVYTITGIVLSIVLLIKDTATTPFLKYFSILLLVVCLLQATVLFAVVNIIMFPIALVTLAAYFLKDPESLEVV